MPMVVPQNDFAIASIIEHLPGKIYGEGSEATVDRRDVSTLFDALKVQTQSPHRNAY